jgi:predicted TIM-barrel fold metal-dependent hydrolase
MLDAYAHLGQPRFLGLDAYRRLMAAHGIEGALVCAFESCPDLAEVHRAIAADPQHFRGLGLPLGRDDREIAAGIRAQMAAGFCGMRLPATLVGERPGVLDLLAELGGIALVVGEHGLAAGAAALVGHLERHREAIVIGGHFAGPSDPGLLASNHAVATLFAHPRFFVVFSRQGFWPAAVIEPWARAVLAKVGWGRVVWGSEVPVLFWRDERLAEQIRWIDRFAPDAAAREAFTAGTLRRLVFDAPARPVRPLDLPYDPWALETKRKSPFAPHGLDIEPEIVGRLIQGWLAEGGEARGTMVSYLERQLDRTLPRLGS